MRLYFLVFWFFASLCFAQNFVLADTLQLNEKDTITDFAVDFNDNLYYVSGYSNLKKIIRNPNGQVYYQDKISFSNRTSLTNINAQNPLQVTVKSMLFNLLVLDNRLVATQDPISFPVGSNFTPTQSFLLDNNFLWGYDPLLQKLILWNYNQNQVFRESVILNNEDANAFYKQLIYNNSKVYLLSDEKILEFDQFANLTKVIPFEPFVKAKIHQNKIYFLTPNHQLFYLDLDDKRIHPIQISIKPQLFDINHQSLFILNHQNIYLYHLTN